VEDRRDENDDTVLRAQIPLSPDRAAEADLCDTIIRLVEPTAPERAHSELARRDSAHSEFSAALAELDPEPGTAPVSLWAIRIRGTAPIVPLDVPAVIGRRPGPPRPTEHPAPRRIVIPADRGDISARHVRVEQLGETLVVVDLGSTNGTVVHWSRGSSLRLRPNESCAVLPDAVIVLGEGVEIEFLAVDALTPAPPFSPQPFSPQSFSSQPFSPQPSEPS